MFTHVKRYVFFLSHSLPVIDSKPSRSILLTNNKGVIYIYWFYSWMLWFPVEELVCLATWKEGSTRYLVGQISQVQRWNSLASDEDTYRWGNWCPGANLDPRVSILCQSTWCAWPWVSRTSSRQIGDKTGKRRCGGGGGSLPAIIARVPAGRSGLAVCKCHCFLLCT